MKTYYLCDLNQKIAISGGELPDNFGNVISCVKGLSDEQLADLNPHGVRGFGFMSYNDALAAHIDKGSLDAAKVNVVALAWLPIQDERDARKESGFFTGEYWFHSDDRSRTQYSVFLSLAIEKKLAASYVLHPAWKTMDGTFVPMTVALLRSIRDAGIASETALFDCAQNHRILMTASDDPLGYDFSAGWPIHFGESVNPTPPETIPVSE